MASVRGKQPKEIRAENRNGCFYKEENNESE